MALVELKNAPHRRFNPLLREWVLISPQRTQRPWQGQTDESTVSAAQAYDPRCYLCPGNVRAHGTKNPSYKSTFVFDNDFPALLPEAPQEKHSDSRLIVAQPESGMCRVGCFSPQHNLAIPLMTTEMIGEVIEMWVEQYNQMASIDWVRHVQIFENRGAMMGASSPHPHCQIWANETIPDDPLKELQAQADYQAQNHRCLLCDYLSLELKLKERLVLENQDFVVLVPYWAVWPFEVLVLSRRHCASMNQFSADERKSLAAALKSLTIRYDNIFCTPFPYSMGFHQCPTDHLDHSETHFHAHYFPPLLRSASIQKFMVGYELLASPQRDITAETAAERLRAVSETHYLKF
ncbi:MAG TPA: UDP-glucose--hexose-1-phosphate uridylyltransferase [Candidatus Acidoferrales bacterium]|jgi:UDPglucose--hexose-1-phosphate uridylyltransferase|nr:UDP-glucose--hexose-1-phosphate uridylyltransferase [Candidatus Acidoferrales bacterium]